MELSNALDAPQDEFKRETIRPFSGKGTALRAEKFRVSPV
jgi:hypothetical protein